MQVAARQWQHELSLEDQEAWNQRALHHREEKLNDWAQAVAHEEAILQLEHQLFAQEKST